MSSPRRGGRANFRKRRDKYGHPDRNKATLLENGRPLLAYDTIDYTNDENDDTFDINIMSRGAHDRQVNICTSSPHTKERNTIRERRVNNVWSKRDLKRPRSVEREGRTEDRLSHRNRSRSSSRERRANRSKRSKLSIITEPRERYHERDNEMYNNDDYQQTGTEVSDTKSRDSEYLDYEPTLDRRPLYQEQVCLKDEQGGDLYDSPNEMYRNTDVSSSYLRYDKGRRSENNHENRLGESSRSFENSFRDNSPTHSREFIDRRRYEKEDRMYNDRREIKGTREMHSPPPRQFGDGESTRNDDLSPTRHQDHAFQYNEHPSTQRRFGNRPQRYDYIRSDVEPQRMHMRNKYAEYRDDVSPQGTKIHSQFTLDRHDMSPQRNQTYNKFSQYRADISLLKASPWQYDCKPGNSFQKDSTRRQVCGSYQQTREREHTLIQGTRTIQSIPNNPTLRHVNIDNDTPLTDQLNDEELGQEVAAELMRCLLDQTACDKTHVAIKKLFEDITNVARIPFNDVGQLTSFLDQNACFKVVNKSVIASINIGICQKYVKKDQHTKTACVGACHSLHICKFYLFGTCAKPNCEMGHALLSLHNELVLRQHRLHRTSLDNIKLLISHPENRNMTTLPVICRFYNNEGNCRKKENCPHLHVCKYSVDDTCKFSGKCKRDHRFNSFHSNKILQKFGLINNNEIVLRKLLKKSIQSKFEPSPPRYFPIQTVAKADVKEKKTKESRSKRILENLRSVDEKIKAKKKSLKLNKKVKKEDMTTCSTVLDDESTKTKDGETQQPLLCRKSVESINDGLLLHYESVSSLESSIDSSEGFRTSLTHAANITKHLSEDNGTETVLDSRKQHSDDKLKTYNLTTFDAISQNRQGNRENSEKNEVKNDSHDRVENDDKIDKPDPTGSTNIVNGDVKREELRKDEVTDSCNDKVGHEFNTCCQIICDNLYVDEVTHGSEDKLRIGHTSMSEFAKQVDQTTNEVSENFDDKHGTGGTLRRLDPIDNVIYQTDNAMKQERENVEVTEIDDVRQETDDMLKRHCHIAKGVDTEGNEIKREQRKDEVPENDYGKQEMLDTLTIRDSVANAIEIEEKIIKREKQKDDVFKSCEVSKNYENKQGTDDILRIHDKITNYIETEDCACEGGEETDEVDNYENNQENRDTLRGSDNMPCEVESKNSIVNHEEQYINHTNDNSNDKVQLDDEMLRPCSTATFDDTVRECFIKILERNKDEITKGYDEERETDDGDLITCIEVEKDSVVQLGYNKENVTDSCDITIRNELSMELLYSRVEVSDSIQSQSQFLIENGKCHNEVGALLTSAETEAEQHSFPMALANLKEEELESHGDDTGDTNTTIDEQCTLVPPVSIHKTTVEPTYSVQITGNEKKYSFVCLGGRWRLVQDENTAVEVDDKSGSSIQHAYNKIEKIAESIMA